MIVKTFSAEYRRKYYAPLFSAASLCSLIAVAATIILPFAIAYASNQLWSKAAVYYEQPQVYFTGEFYIAAITSNATRSYCSLHSVQQTLGNNILNPIIEHASEDTNDDGLNDILTMRALFQVDQSTLSRIDIIIGLNYALPGIANMEMRSAVFTSIETAAGASEIKAIGELHLRQLRPIPFTQRRQVLYSANQVFASLLSGEYMTALQEYNARNETLHFAHDTVVLPYGRSSQTSVEVKLRVPLYQRVVYAPGFLEMLKFGWVQYVSLLIPIYYIMYTFLVWLVIHYRIFSSASEEDDALLPSFFTLFGALICLYVAVNVMHSLIRLVISSSLLYLYINPVH